MFGRILPFGYRLGHCGLNCRWYAVVPGIPGRPGQTVMMPEGVHHQQVLEWLREQAEKDRDAKAVAGVMD